MMTIQTIPLPEFGLTCKPPWPQAMAFAGKDVENRDKHVASRLGDYRGLVAISQSKTWNAAEQCDALEDIVRAGLTTHETILNAPITFWDARVALVVDLLRIEDPRQCHGKRWHIFGQHGLILGRKWLVEPHPCTGGVGAWKPLWCVHCKRVAASTSTKGPKCPGCKRGDWLAKPTYDRPMLRVVREVTHDD